MMFRIWHKKNNIVETVFKQLSHNSNQLNSSVKEIIYLHNCRKPIREAQTLSCLIEHLSQL